MCTDLAMPIAIVLAALITVVGASLTWRSAQKTLRHKQYETAAQQLQAVDRPGGWNYVTRTAAIGALAKLARDHPKEYDEPVMRAFEAFLSFPPRYGKNAEKEGQVDYTSRETVAIMETINNRKACARDRYRVSLPPGRPFLVTDRGDVERNPDYEEPAGMGIHRSTE